MRRILTLIILVMALGIGALGQQGNTVTIQTHGTPTGSCSGIMRAVDIDNNLLYFCSAATWLAATAGGVTPSGTLTLNHVALGGGTSVVKVDSSLVTDGAGALSGATSISTGTAPTACGSATGCFAATEASTAGTPTSGQDFLRFDSGIHGVKWSFNGGAEGPLNALSGGTGVADFAFQGTTSHTALSAGVVSGTAATLCTDANGSATTSGCTTSITINNGYLSPWSGASSVALAANNRVEGWGFVPIATVSFSTINVVSNTADGAGAYTLNIVDSSGNIVCHPTSGAVIPTANTLFTSTCSEGTVTLTANSVYILIFTGNSTTGKLSAATSNTMAGQYFSNNIAGCSSSSGVLSGTCTISLATAVYSAPPVFYLK